MVFLRCTSAVDASKHHTRIGFGRPADHPSRTCSGRFANGSLTLVGRHLKRLDPLLKRLDAQLPCRGGLLASTLIRSYVGLLAQSKSDFDSIEGFRGDRFFKEALGLKGVPSAPTLRQRLPLAGNCVPGRCRPARVRPW